jgi:hypothetical protein
MPIYSERVKGGERERERGRETERQREREREREGTPESSSFICSEGRAKFQLFDPLPFWRMRR